MATTQELDLAHAFARAYRDIDGETMRGLLAPAARIRLLIPRGLTELEGPDGLTSALRQLAERWRREGADELEIEVLAQNLLKTGRLVSLGQRLRLRSVADEAKATMVAKHLLAITDGKITVVDELCGGVMPESK
jgi:hypothetical protein